MTIKSAISIRLMSKSDLQEYINDLRSYQADCNTNQRNSINDAIRAAQRVLDNK